MKLTTKIYSIFTFISASVLALTLAVGNTKTSLFTRGASNEYEIELDASNSPSDLSVGSYAREGNASGVFTKGDYSLNLKYRLAQKESNQHVVLAPHGFMYNEVDTSTHKNKITSLTSVRATYSSDSNLTIRTSTRNDGKEFGAPQVLTNNTLLSFDDEPYYFIIEAGDSAAHISNIVFTYSCNTNSLHLSSLEGSYTGKGSDNYIYKLTLNGSSINLASLNKQTNFSYNGTADIVNNSQLRGTFTVNSITGHYITSVSEDHRTLTFVSKDGSLSSLPTITFYRVYKVEDFENYNAQGDGFGGSGRGADSLYSMSGLRSQWHADWYTSSSSYAVSYFGNSDWKVMGSTDFLSYTSNKGHNSTKAAAFKGNTNGLRYIQMKAPLGLPNIIGRGTHMSFWAKVYSNSGLSTVKTTDTSVKVYAFYNQTVTSANLGTRTDANITIPANSDWARYTIELDSSKDYYSFGFYDNKGSTMYMVVDDVEIYTEDPYAEYVPPYPEGTFVGSATCLGNSWTVILAIGNRTNGLVAVRFSNTDAEATSISFNTSTNLVTIATTGGYKKGSTTYKFGTITGTYDIANDRITGISCSGSIGSYVDENGTMIASRPTNTSTTYFYGFDDDTSTLQSMFKRRWDNGGGWQVDSSNSDRFTSNKEQFVSGKGSMKRRGYKNTGGDTGRVAHVFNTDWATTRSITAVQYWVYNPSDADITIRMWGFKGASLASNFETGTVTAKANQWTYVAMGFTTASIYNFQIADFTNSGVYLSFDNIFFY